VLRTAALSRGQDSHCLLYRRSGRRRPALLPPTSAM